jgi:hypothetical protein
LIERVVDVGDYEVVISGVIVMVAAVAAPDGIAGACSRAYEQMSRRRRSLASVPVAAEGANA